MATVLCLGIPAALGKAANGEDRLEVWPAARRPEPFGGVASFYKSPPNRSLRQG